MGDGNNSQLDLKALLRINELNIRKLSKDNLSLQAGEYFKAVSKFINRIPMVLEALIKIASMKAGEYDYRCLMEVKNLMEDMGCDKYPSTFDSIVSACKRGHSKFAADSSKGILEEFNGFCKRVSAVQGSQESNAAYQDDSFKALPLKDVLLLLDQGVTQRKAKILAVDDSPVMLKTITSILSNDYDVYGMADPTKVKSFLEKVTPDLFLLDYKMPEISGFELVPVIRNTAEHKATPIIFLTAMGTPDYVSAALALGACDYIVKPFQGESLRAKVAKHITRKKTP